MSGGIQTAEPRTFEQRFGKKCPFCNRTWGNPEPCDPIGDTKTWHQTNKRFFVKPNYAERNCAVCLRAFSPRSLKGTTCSAECATIRNRLLNNERSRRYKARQSELARG